MGYNFTPRKPAEVSIPMAIIWFRGGSIVKCGTKGLGYITGMWEIGLFCQDAYCPKYETRDKNKIRLNAVTIK